MSSASTQDTDQQQKNQLVFLYSCNKESEKEIKRKNSIENSIKKNTMPRKQFNRRIRSVH